MFNYNVIKEIRPGKIYLVQNNIGRFYQKKYPSYQEKSENLWGVLKKLENQKNKHIVEIHKVSKDNEYINVIEEACSDENLRQYTENNKLNYSDILKCLLDIIEGLMELKNLKMMHRDIKPDNIVYDKKTKNFKIIDFETAKLIENDVIKFQSIEIGTSGYRAPQFIFHQRYSPKCDIWSLGCVLYFLLQKKDILCEKNIKNQTNFESIINQINLDDQNLNDLLKGMLQIEEEKRIDLTNLREQVQKLQIKYNPSILSTQIGNQTIQDINASRNTEQNISNNTQNDIGNNISNEIQENFNIIMTNLIQKEKNAQQRINLYSFWLKILDQKFKDDDSRKQIGNQFLIQIKDFKNKKIKINLFITIDEIRDSLRTIQELSNYLDFLKD